MATPPGALTDLGGGAWFTLADGWVDDADAVFAALRDGQPWAQRPVYVFGRELPQPRLTAWAGELPYRYSGQTLPAQPADAVVATLMASASAACGVAFNHALLNLYRGGHDKMGLHADNEPELGKDPVIASISLGETRRFRLVPKDKRARPRTVWLEHGSLLVMGGTLQHRWRHEVPGTNKPLGARINITLRHILGPPGWRSAG